MTTAELVECVRLVDEALAHAPGVGMSGAAWGRFYKQQQKARSALRRLVEAWPVDVPIPVAYEQKVAMLAVLEER